MKRGRKPLEMSSDAKKERIRCQNRKAQMRRRENLKNRITKDKYIINKEQIDYITLSIEKMISFNSIADINFDKILFILKHLKYIDKKFCKNFCNMHT